MLKKRNYQRVCVAILLIVFIWVLSWLAGRWLIVSAPLDHADAIVILSGSSTLLERAQHAARLYSERRAPKILLTNDNQQGSWSSVEQRNPYFYEIAFNELRRLGVPAENIEILEPPVTSTRDEALLVSRYCTSHELRSILIVTSAYHSRRALWTFRTLFTGNSAQLGLDPVQTGIQTPTPATWLFYRRGWQVVLVEYLKLGYYHLALK